MYMIFAAGLPRLLYSQVEHDIDGPLDIDRARWRCRDLGISPARQLLLSHGIPCPE